MASAAASWEPPSASSVHVDQPETRASELTGVTGGRLVAVSGDRAAVAAPDGTLHTFDGAAALLRRNLTIYGLGGLIVPFLGIKAIDMAVTALGLA